MDKVVKGSAISTAYSKIEYTFTGGEAQELDATMVINSNTIINVGAGGDSSDITIVDDNVQSGDTAGGGMIGGIVFPFVTTYGITLVNKDAESCTVTATRKTGGTTEVVTLAEDASVTLALKISANKTIGDVYSSIIADYDGTTLELDTTTVVTQDIEVELEKPVGE